MKNNKENQYFVWKRIAIKEDSDIVNSHISCSCNYMPLGYRCENGTVVTFEKLGQFDNWNVARQAVVNEINSK